MNGVQEGRGGEAEDVKVRDERARGEWTIYRDRG